MTANDDATVHWHGELLWPHQLPEAATIDMSDVAAVGAWVYTWFRRHPQCAVVGARPTVRAQLQRAGVPVLWYTSHEEARGRPDGVTPDERQMLWDTR